MAGATKDHRPSPLRLLVLAAVFAVLVPVAALGALEVLKLQGRVNDYAGMISVAAREQLEDKLRSLE